MCYSPPPRLGPPQRPPSLDILLVLGSRQEDQLGLKSVFYD
jgi:hypothetical protein